MRSGLGRSWLTVLTALKPADRHPWASLNRRDPRRRETGERMDDATRTTKAKRAWLTRALLAAALSWTLAVLLTATFQPNLLDDRAVIRLYAFASLQIATFRFHVGCVALLL